MEALGIGVLSMSIDQFYLNLKTAHLSTGFIALLGLPLFQPFL